MHRRFVVSVDARRQQKGVVRARKTPDAGGCREAESGSQHTRPHQRNTTATGITLHLSDELETRLAEEAARQSVTPEELAAHTLAEYILTRPHHGPAAIDEPTAPVAEPSRPTAATPGEQPGRSRRSVRLIAEVPSALWVGGFLLFYAAMFILIVVLIAQAL